MEISNCPLVSVPVITYNSSKTVLETLESIKAQTYLNIELIISDDCSTDDTVAICKKWVSENENRFVRVVVLESPVNTGISANGNRAESVCRGEWVKGIAGDDLLLPECVESCVNYVISNTSTICLFGKIQSFGAEEQRCIEVDSWFDYSFFALTQEQQIHRLLFEGNCIPASTLFFNKNKIETFQIKNDERIPLLEDWAKWINFLKAGIRFDFIDKVLVNYRVGGISTSKNVSLEYFRANRQMFFYYLYPELEKKGEELAVSSVADYETELYRRNLDLSKELLRIQQSKPYRFYMSLLYPIISKIKKW